MSNVNKAIIIGRLGQDPDIRHTQTGQTVANLSAATSERYKDKSGQQQEQTEWHRITLWGKLGEIAEQYLKKGDLVYIEGKLKTRKWTDKNGQDRYTTEIVGNELRMLSSKSDSATTQPTQTQPAPIADSTDDGLPF